MDIKKFEALSAIVSFGSLCKAAAKLNYSQPGLTSMINRLEDELGLTLLVRSSKGVKLTERGAELMPVIQKLLASYEELEVALTHYREKRETVIYIGAYPSTAILWLPKAISYLKKEYPVLDVIVKTGLGQEILEWVEDGSVDIAVFSKHFKAENAWISLAKDRYCAVFPKGMRTEKIFNIKDFEGQKFLMPSMHADLDVLQALLDNKVTPNISRVSVDDPTVISMVERGLGISMISELVLEAYAKDKSIQALPIKQESYRELGISIKSTKNITPELKKFISCIKKSI